MNGPPMSTAISEFDGAVRVFAQVAWGLWGVCLRDEETESAR
jgi:hypothetical protein